MLGLHIGFSGIDGAGKSTQTALLVKWLREGGENAIRYEETRNFVQEVTDLIGMRHRLNSGREYLGEGLYMVSMSFEILRHRMLSISPYVAQGMVIVSSRTFFDWLAGAMARGCPPKELAIATEIVLLGGLPDLTIWLDVSADVALDRLKNRGFDTADIGYLRRYRDAFSHLFTNYPHVRVNGDGEIGTVELEVQHVVGRLLAERRA